MRKYLFASFALFLFITSYFYVGSMTKIGNIEFYRKDEKMSLIYSSHAFGDHLAFSVKTEPGSVDMFVYNLNEGTGRKFGLKGYNLTGATIGKAGDIFLVGYPKDSPKNSKLYKCNLGNNFCKFILERHGSIGEVKPLPDGSLIYTFSPVDETFDEIGYSEYDFYIEKDGKTNRLTYIKYSTLTSINILTNSVLYAGRSPDRAVAEKFDFPYITNSMNRSDISRIYYTDNIENMEVTKDVFIPIVNLKGNQSHPAAISNSSIIGFTNAMRIGGDYKIGISIYDLLAGKLLDQVWPEGDRFSPPYFIDETTLLFFEHVSEEYRIYLYDIVTMSVDGKLILTLDEIRRAKNIEVGGRRD